MKTQILQLLGFSPKSVNRLDEPSQMQMVFSAFTVWLVASLSALLFGITISNLCFEGKYFWPIAGVWFLFIYALDTLVLGADARKSTVLWIRFGICLILAGFHSLTLDTFVFHQDITNYLTRQHNAQVAELDSIFQSQKITPLLLRKDSLQSRNQELFRAEKESRDRVYEEVNEGSEGRPPGRGEYAIYKERVHAADSTLFANERVINDTQIGRIEDELAVFNTELGNRKAELVEPESAGLRDHVNALYKLVWGPEGNIMDRVYFVLLFLGGFLFESLVLIAKLSFGRSFEAYQNEVDAERDRVSAQQDKKRVMEDEIEEMEWTKDFQKRSYELQREIEIQTFQSKFDLSKAKAEARFQSVKDEAELVFESIKDTDHIDQKIREELNGLHEKYGKPLVTDFRLEKIKKIAEELRNEKS